MSTADGHLGVGLPPFNLKREVWTQPAFQTAIRNINEKVINSIKSSRIRWQEGMGGDDRRRISDECGYPSPDMLLDPWFYWEKFDRDAISNKVVSIFPNESWKVSPQVYEDESPETETEFEKAFNQLPQQISKLSTGTGFGFFKASEEGNPLWNLLKRLDILSGIGRYGAALIGVNDGRLLTQPAFDSGTSSTSSPNETGQRGTEDQYGNSPLEGSTYDGSTGTRPENEGEKQVGGEGTGGDSEPLYPGISKLTFIRVFPEALAPVVRTEDQPYNPRYGYPAEYQLSFQDDRQGSQSGNISSMNAHWSRVVHVADNRLNSDVYGNPRMRPVINRLYDLEKTYGGSGEMYWRGAFPGISIESHPMLGGEVNVDDEAMRDQLEQYMNGLQRYLLMIGVQVKSLAPQVVDPSPHIERYLEAICIQLDIPLRIFKGSERGELASSQDKESWEDRLRGRRENYLSPYLIAPFIERLILLGVLPQPKDGFTISWPEQDFQTEGEKADVAVKYTQAMTQYVSGGVESVLPPMYFFTRILGWSEDDATAVIEDAVEHEAEMHEQDLERQEEEQERLGQESSEMPLETDSEGNPVEVPVKAPEAGEGKKFGNTRDEGKTKPKEEK